MVTESYGKYRDPEKDEYTEDMGFFAALFMPCPTMTKTEYCITEYSLATVNVVAATDKYAFGIKLEEIPETDKQEIHATVEQFKRKIGLKDE